MGIAMNYRVVFDIADAGYKSWTAPAFGLIFVVVGAFLVANRKHLRAGSGFAFFFLSFAVLWTLVIFIATYHDYTSMASARKGGRARIVEGRITEFRPMPFTGHAMERFCVGSDCFEYSDYVVTAGFNNTSSHGGPIKDDLPVRVTFVGNAIIKLEVALEGKSTQVNRITRLTWERTMGLPLYWSIGFGLIILGRTIHYFAVARYLKQRGILVEHNLFGVRDWAEWAAYKKAVLSDGQPLTWWYVLWTIQVILMFWLAGWFAMVW
jgi:hypothetical protein